jgi:hypothetical protein
LIKFIAKGFADETANKLIFARTFYILSSFTSEIKHERSLLDEAQGKE